MAGPMAGPMPPGPVATPWPGTPSLPMAAMAPMGPWRPASPASSWLELSVRLDVRPSPSESDSSESRPGDRDDLWLPRRLRGGRPFCEAEEK